VALVGYCPNCGRAIEHDGEDAECAHCQITWTGGTARGALKPEPYAPGELEAIHAEATRRFGAADRSNPFEEEPGAPVV